MHRTCVRWSTAAAILLGVSCTCPLASAQNEEQAPPSPLRLINIDTPATTGRGKIHFLADMRAFGSAEDRVFGSLQLGLGLSDTADLIVRGAFADRGDYVAYAPSLESVVLPGRRSSYYGGLVISHGGTDFELMTKLRSAEHPNVALAAGIAFPDTPAQKVATVTAGLLCEAPIGSHVTVNFAPRMAAVRTPIVGIGGGLTVRISRNLSVLGDVTGIVGGHNSYSILTGRQVRQEVWGLGVRYIRDCGGGQWNIDLGVTNGLGGTTGFSLSPGLGGSAAVYLGIGYRR